VGSTGVLVVIVVIALSKGLVVTVVANSILIVVVGTVHLLGVLSSICHPEIRKTPPPYTPHRPRILSIIPPIAAANYRLIVVSYNQTATT
jgi:hypothetical protein